MRLLYTYTIKFRHLIMVAFLVATVISAFCYFKVDVDYNINDYLPEDSPSTTSLDKMDEEFDEAIPNARIMYKNVSRNEAVKLKEKLENVPGVMAVNWIDTYLPYNVPFDMVPEETMKTYYKNNNALFVVTVDEEQQETTIPKLYKMLGKNGSMTGSAVSTVVAMESTIKEIQKIVVIAVAFILFVLILTTNSWAEPFIVLGGLAVAIVLNAGSNLIFGEISFVTNAAGSILQLAVSLDYSVFLIHRFEEYKHESEPKEAMINALVMSTPSILSSGLTTVIGFLALVMMRFRLGPDLGLALAKGVALSLLTVFFFMPGLILMTFRLMDRTTHRPFVPSFHRFGKFVNRITIPLAIGFFIVIAPSYLASTHNSYYYGSSHIFGTNTQLGQHTKIIEDAFGKNDTYAIMVPNGDMKRERNMIEELDDIPQVSSVLSVASILGPEIPVEMVPTKIKDQLCSDNYDRIVLNIEADYEGDETFRMIEKIRGIVNSYYPNTYYMAGEGVCTYDLMDTVTADMLKVNFLAIAAIFIVLLLTMQSVIVPAILVIAIETSIWVNLSIPFLTKAPVFFIVYLIISSVQLGATVDYAILLTDRYKENRMANGLTKRESVIETISNVTVSILTSASVLTVVGFLLGKLSTHGLIAQLGTLLGQGTLCSLFTVLFILPGLLMIFDRFFVKEKKQILKSSVKKLKEKRKQTVASL